MKKISLLKAILGFVSLLFGLSLAPDVRSDEHAFFGSGTGSIPDAPGPNCNITGSAKIVTFAVSGITHPLVSVSITLSATHNFVSDLQATLIAPEFAPSATLFGDTGQVGNSGADSSDLNGNYTFGDTQTGDWWAAAIAVDANQPIPPGGYRSSNNQSAEPTSLDAVFAGVSPNNANGVWMLRLVDDCPGDSGSISNAVLTLDDTASIPVFSDGFE